jgi:hypothetical protein
MTRLIGESKDGFGFGFGDWLRVWVGRNECPFRPPESGSAPTGNILVLIHALETRQFSHPRSLFETALDRLRISF